MSDERNRDRDRRPSWRELDRKKDRSAHVGADGRRSGLEERKATTGYHRYKNDLDSLFSTGEASSMVKEVMKKSPAAAGPTGEGAGKKKKKKGAPERQKLLRAIREATSSSALTRHLDEFLEKWELPDDIEILTQALGHPDEEIQIEVLGRLSSFLDGHVPRHKKLLQSKVRTLSTRSDDEEVRALAKEVNSKL